jgi:hypothetical protein
MKIHLVGDKLIAVGKWMDGQTDRHEKAKGRFHNNVSVSRKWKSAHLLRRANKVWESIKAIISVVQLLSCWENDNSNTAVFILFHHT